MRMTDIKFLLSAFTLSCLFFMLGACGGAYDNQIPEEESDNLVLGAGSSISTEQLVQGRTLYDKHCAACHGQWQVSEKRNRSDTQIITAINRINEMQNIILDPNDVELITLALNFSDSDINVDIDASSVLGAGSDIIEEADESLSIQSIMAKSEVNCTNSSCHDATPNAARINLLTGSLGDLAERLVNVSSGSNHCSGELLIDENNPKNSLLYKLIDSKNGNQCMSKMPFGSAGIPDIYLVHFEHWINEIISAKTSTRNIEISEADNNSQEIENDTVVLGAKIKYIINGNALTDSELTTMTQEDGALNQEGLSSVIDQWMASPNYDDKLKNFFKVALQQQTVNGDFSSQLHGIARYGKIRYNLEEIFSRTALRIAKSNQSFKKVITTRDWELSTVGMAALAYADDPARPRTTYFRDLDFVDTDFDDWRTVSLSTASVSPYADDSIFQNSSFIENFRNIPDGGSLTLKTPRVGFFTTPVFFDQWRTNSDNQFRLNANQTMIVALGLTFSSGDPTFPHQVHLDELNADHVPVGSDCFGCHKNLDPMRNVFMNYFNPVTFRSVSNEGGYLDYFSFQGEQSDIGDIFDFASDVSDHPNFAKAWTLKLCHWVNSVSCASYADEIDSIAAQFRDSEYQFQSLMKALLMSNIVTNTVYDEASLHPGSFISITRQDHFCEALAKRLDAVRHKRGFPEVDKVWTNLCQHNRLRSIAAGFPSDDFARGAVDSIHPANSDMLVSAAFGQFCDIASSLVVGGNNTHTFKSNNVDHTLDDMTQHLLGIPSNASNYQYSRDHLQRIYEVGRNDNECASDQALEESLSGSEVDCGLGLSTVLALRLVWMNVCQTPSLTGIGL